MNCFSAAYVKEKFECVVCSSKYFQYGDIGLARPLANYRVCITFLEFDQKQEGLALRCTGQTLEART